MSIVCVFIIIILYVDAFRIDETMEIDRNICELLKTHENDELMNELEQDKHLIT